MKRLEEGSLQLSGKGLFADLDPSRLRTHWPSPASPNDRIPISPRNVADYVTRLELTVFDLLEKQFLDEGAGYSDFGDVVKATFGSPLISVDGAYANFPVDHFSAQFQARFLTTRKPMDIHRMELPDESFDLVVSNTLLNRIFFGSGKATRRRVDDGFQTLKYMIRVTKVGGEIRTTDVPEPGANQRNVHRLDREVARYYLIRMGQLLEENAGRMVIVYPTYEGGYGRMTKIRKIRWP